MMEPQRFPSDMDSVFVGRLLIGRLMSALLEAHDKALSQLGLTTRQGMVLLNCTKGEAKTASVLAFYNGLDVSSMSRMLDRLEKKGLLERHRSEKDRRVVLVKLTRKGHALVGKAVPVAAEVAKHAWQNVTEQERKTFRGIVYKILGNLGHFENT